MATEIEDCIAHFKTREFFLNYSTLGSLRDWLKQVWDESEERSSRYGDLNDLPAALDEYMRPRRIGDSMNDRIPEIEKDLACVLEMVKQFGESKRITEI